MAAVFGGRLSVGATLPMLIFADCFAVAFYRQNAQWDRIRQLLPWVVIGLAVGTWMLNELALHKPAHDPLNPIIGAIVLGMLAVTLARNKIGDKFAPHGPVGTRATGILAGFTTMVSNAAGPVMQIYFVGTGMVKEKMMGTTATFFFIINLSKVLPLIWLTQNHPQSPLLTAESIKFDLLMLPIILLGALVGKRVLTLIPQKQFNQIVLVLSAVAAVKLLLS